MPKRTMENFPGKLGEFRTDDTLIEQARDLMNEVFVVPEFHVFHGSVGKMNQMDQFPKNSKYATPKPFLSFTDSKGVEYHAINRNGK